MSGADRRLPEIDTGGRHRAPRRKQPILVRTMVVGGAVGCIALVAEMNAPNADALSILLPAGNGNATQINILEGNIFDPQLGLGGNGANTSHNSTIGNLIFNLGNNSDEGTAGGGIFGPIKLGGATGNGNVTQVNILSYNIINPQFSLTGGNLSQNTAINNVAMHNGNNSDTTVTSSSGAGLGFFGGAIGNGNTTQLAFLSGNIFNPQFSLFGDNVSNNVAITNVAAFNGNESDTNITGGMFGTGLFGSATGNGNTNQIAGITSNIFNPQFSLLGRNESHNTSNTNQASYNGGTADSDVGSTGGGPLGNNFLLGITGNGNATQNAFGTGNIINDQLRLGLGGLLPSTQQPPATTTTTTQPPLTNEQVNSGTPQPGMSEEDLLELGNQQPGTSGGMTVGNTPRPLKTALSRIKTAVDETLDRITKPKQKTPAADNTPAAQDDHPDSTE